MARYEIRRVSSEAGVEGIEATLRLRGEHESMRWHDDAAAAVASAQDLATEYHYGTVIVDHQERTIDWGDVVTDLRGAEPRAAGGTHEDAATRWPDFEEAISEAYEEEWMDVPE